MLTAVLLSSCPAAAETISDEIARTGLAPTEARLAALPSRTDAESFALGGVQFLRAIEISFQLRWSAGLTDRSAFLPLLRAATAARNRNSCSARGRMPTHGLAHALPRRPV